MSDVLQRWIAESYTRYASDYEGGLTNHLPMALVAMKALGADDARLDAFARAYVTRLEPAVPGELDHARRLAGRIERGLSSTVIREHSLERGIAGAAFHGVIGMDYACHQPDPVELGRAIAYASRTSMPLPVHDPSPSTADVIALAERLRSLGLDKPSGHTIAERMEHAARDPKFQQVARELAVEGEDTRRRIALLGARAYLAKGDFASLHVLTGAAAYRGVRDAFADPTASDHALGVAALAAFASAGTPALAPERPDLPIDPWEQIAASAITTDDDHVAKLTLACKMEWEASGEPIFAAIATRVSRRGATWG